MCTKCVGGGIFHKVFSNAKNILQIINLFSIILLLVYKDICLKVSSNLRNPFVKQLLKK